MPKRYGVKEKDEVVAHILELLLTGRLRSGDRVDRNAVAAELGLSRVPIQEAMIQLEHDGILVIRYHRGAYVERFDADVLREHHSVHGLLTGETSARAAADRGAAAPAELAATLHALRRARDPGMFIDASERYRAAIVDAYAGPRLRAAIRASRSLMPRGFWSGYDAAREILLPFAEEEHRAICDGSAEHARRTCMERVALMADVLVEELRRRGVFDPSS